MAGWWLLHFWVCLLWLGHLAFGTDPRMIMIIFLKLFFMENDGSADHDDVLFLYFEVQIKTLPLFGRNCSFRVNNDHWNHVNYNFWYVQLIQSVRECRERLSTSIDCVEYCVLCSAVYCDIVLDRSTSASECMYVGHLTQLIQNIGRVHCTWKCVLVSSVFVICLFFNSKNIVFSFVHYLLCNVRYRKN